MNLGCKITLNQKIPIVQVGSRFKLIQYSQNSQYCLRKLNERSRRTGVYIYLFLPYKYSNSSYMTQQSIKLLNKNNQRTITLLSHISQMPCHSGDFSSQVSSKMKKISYSKRINFNEGINYNEENKLFKEENQLK